MGPIRTAPASQDLSSDTEFSQSQYKYALPLKLNHLRSQPLLYFRDKSYLLSSWETRDIKK